jgi:hypothetical protein
MLSPVVRQILTTGPVVGPVVLAQLFQGDCPAYRATQAASDSDILRIRWPREIAAVTTATFIPQGANQCIRGCNINLQGCGGIAARCLNAQLPIAR